MSKAAGTQYSHSKMPTDSDDLLGDGVNVAASLEQICEPGSVLISGTAYDQLQGKIDLPTEFAGEQRVKNIERPIRTKRVRRGPGSNSAGPLSVRQVSGWTRPRRGVHHALRRLPRIAQPTALSSRSAEPDE
jgi:hypothetical protein